MSKELHAAKAQRKRKHEQRVARLREILLEKGYNSTGVMSNRKLDIEFFLGAPDSVVFVVELLNHKDTYRVDIFVPMEYAAKDDTLEALRMAAAS